MRRRRNPEVISGQVSNVSVPTSGDGFTAVSGGAGIHQVFLPSNFRIISVVATPNNPSAAMVTVDGGTGAPIVGNSFVVRTYTAAGALAGVPWTFVAVGVQQ